MDHKGDLRRLTVSSDAAINSPRTLLEQLQACVREHGFPLELVLPLFTSNTAHVLQLPRKGKLAEGTDGDVLIWDKETLALREVIAHGRPLMRDGQICITERFLEGSNRRVHLNGQRH